MIVTTTELVQRAMAAGDLHDAPISKNQWMFWATQENLALSLFCARAGWTLNAKTTTLTVAGTEAGSYTLPSTVVPLAIVAVHEVKDERTRLLTLSDSVDFLRQTPGSTRVVGHPLEYRVMWDEDNDRLTLGFYPEPTVGTTILVTYIPTPLKLTLDSPVTNVSTNSVSYPMGWEERIVLGMARRGLVKEGEDTHDLRVMIQEEESRIEEACWDRVLSESPQVRNTDYARGWKDRLTYPPPTYWWWA